MRQAPTPLLSEDEANKDAWYLCYCRGDYAPTYMISPDDPRTVPKYTDRKQKRPKRFVNDSLRTDLGPPVFEQFRKMLSNENGDKE